MDEKELSDKLYFETVFQKYPLSEMGRLTWKELNKTRFDMKVSAIYLAGAAAQRVAIEGAVDEKKFQLVNGAYRGKLKCSHFPISEAVVNGLCELLIAAITAAAIGEK